MKLRATAVPSLIAIGLLAPGASQAASLTADRACYGPGERIGLLGAGFTPSGQVALSNDGRQLGVGSADPAGGFTVGVPAAVIDAGTQTSTYTATDQANLALTASAPVTLTALDVRVTPRRGNPAKPRRIKARGFTTGKTLWAHVRRGKKRRNVKVGALRGPCGTIDAKRRIFSSGTKPGVYEVRFDTRRRYSQDARPQVTFLVTIYRTVKPASLSSTAQRWTEVRPSR